MKREAAVNTPREAARLKKASARTVLTDLMRNSRLDVVRMAAARALIKQDEEIKTPRAKKGKKEVDETKRREEDEISTAIAEARALLVAFAEAKTACVGLAGAVDQGGAASTADALGEVADLACAGGPRVGEDADGG